MAIGATTSAAQAMPRTRLQPPVTEAPPAPADEKKAASPLAFPPLTATPALETYAPSKALLGWAETADVKTIPQLFARSVQEHGDNPFVGRKEKDGYQYQTYKQVARQVDQFSSALVQLGLPAGNRVGIIANNDVPWPITDLGTQQVGGVLTPLFPELSASDMEYIFKDSRCKVAVVGNETQLKRLISVEKNLPDLEHIIVLSPTKQTSTKHLTNWSDFLKLGADHLAQNRAEIDRRAAALKPTDIATIVYTSGTTGDPKGTMLAQGAIASNVLNVQQAIHVDSHDIEFSFIPLSHIFQRSVYYAVVASGASSAYVENLRHYGQNLQEAKPTILPAVPRIFDGLVDKMAAEGNKKPRFAAPSGTARTIAGAAFGAASAGVVAAGTAVLLPIAWPVLLAGAVATTAAGAVAGRSLAATPEVSKTMASLKQAVSKWPALESSLARATQTVKELPAFQKFQSTWTSYRTRLQASGAQMTAALETAHEASSLKEAMQSGAAAGAETGKVMGDLTGLVGGVVTGVATAAAAIASPPVALALSVLLGAGTGKALELLGAPAGRAVGAAAAAVTYERANIKKQMFKWGMSVGREYLKNQDADAKPSAWLSVQHALAERLVYPKLRAGLGGAVRLAVAGGAALDKETDEKLRAIGINLVSGYGMTECSVISFNPPDKAKNATAGKAVPGVAVEIAPDGEILVSSPSVMNGYLGKPEATAESIDAQGRLHTGDIGHLDSDSYIDITDRKKNLLVLANGKKVAPTPIEGRLQASPYIKSAVCLGDKQTSIGALIVPRFDALEEWAKAQHIPCEDHAELIKNPDVIKLIRSEVQARCEDMSDYEKVRGVALLPAEFSKETGELTETLKLKRNVVKEKYKAEIESLF